jgi:proteic killer suppression protein
MGWGLRKHGIPEVNTLLRARLAGHGQSVPTRGTLWRMIKSFADKRTAAIFAGYAVRGLASPLQGRVRAKLLALDAAGQLDDLRVPPGNRLEVPRGDRQGEYSIRINDQWRLCHVWHDGAAWDVEVADYH